MSASFGGPPKSIIVYLPMFDEAWGRLERRPSHLLHLLTSVGGSDVDSFTSWSLFWITLHIGKMLTVAWLLWWDGMWWKWGGGFWVTETSCPLQHSSIRGQPSEPPLSLLNIQPPSIIKCSLFELEECCDSKINVPLMHGAIRRA